MNLDYAGDLSPPETWDKIKENADCFLVDCRTSAEWSLIGVPDLDSLGKKVIFIEWQIFPTMEKNQRFLQEISETNLKKNSKIIDWKNKEFKCKIQMISGNEKILYRIDNQSYNSQSSNSIEVTNKVKKIQFFSRSDLLLREFINN